MRTLKLVVVLVVLGMGTAMAQKGQCIRSERGNNRHQGKFVSTLDDAQKEQVKAMHVEFTKEITPLKAELGVLEAELAQASIGDNVDVKAVNKLIDQMSELKATMAKKNFANKQNVRSILTDEQKVMFDAKAGQMMKRKQNSKGGKPQGRPGHHRANAEKDIPVDLS